MLASDVHVVKGDFDEVTYIRKVMGELNWASMTPLLICVCV